MEPITAEIKEAVSSLWQEVVLNWTYIYNLLNSSSHIERNKMLELFYRLSGELITKYIDYEFTIGEVNRVYFPEANKLVELYISPKLLLKNVSIMEYVVSKAPNLPNLQIIKYRTYNIKDELISSIEYKNITTNYDDFGCQYFNGINDKKEALLNLVIYVKNPLAEQILKKREVTFIDDSKTETKLLKWLPTETNAIDLFLLNMIGEYNLIHRTGYIEFLPEGDPLITPGSVFTELSDLKGAYELLNTNSKCHVCNRYTWQKPMLHCSKCKDTIYCGQVCQKIDFHNHKLFCSQYSPST